MSNINLAFVSGTPVLSCESKNGGAKMLLFTVLL